MYSDIEANSVHGHDEGDLERVTERSGTSSPAGSVNGSRGTSGQESGSESRLVSKSSEGSFNSGSEGSVSSESVRYAVVSVGSKHDLREPGERVVDIANQDDSNKVFISPFKADMEPKEKMLRYFLLLGIFPLPIIGWIIGLFSSLSIKKKRRIHRRLTGLLFLLSSISLVAGMVVLGFFLVRNTTVDGAATTGKQTSQVEGIYVPKIIDTFKMPAYKVDEPKLQFIPPEHLEAPLPKVTVSKELTYEHFKFTHPSSKKNMFILMRGLSKGWEEHSLFKLSDYVDHNVHVVHVPQFNKTKSLSELLDVFNKTLKLSELADLTLVTEIRDGELSAFETKYSELNIKRLLAINPRLRCHKDSAKMTTEILGIIDEKITCTKSEDVPIQLTQAGVVKYVARGSKFTDITKYLLTSSTYCLDFLGVETHQKKYLDTVYEAFRKFVKTISEIKNPESVKVLCSKL